MQIAKEDKPYKFDLSILVVSYNTNKLLYNCIKSILNYKGKYQIEVVVVDNNSTDGTKEMVSDNFSQIKYIQSKFNYGFAVGMNLAYRVAEGEFVMTFNPDAEIFNESVDAAVEYLRTNQDTGLLGMLTEDSIGEFKLIEKIETIRLFFPKKNIEAKEGEKVKEVNWIWGTSIFARKKDLGNTFFIEDNFLFWEEYWLAKKIKSKGLKIKILMNYKMLHHISASFKADYRKLEIVRILGDVNGHSAKINEYGYIKTYLSYIVKVIDHFVMFLLLNVLRLFKSNNVMERKLSVINHKAHLKAYFNLFFLGKKYQVKYQKFAVQKLNNGVLPPPTSAAI